MREQENAEIILDTNEQIAQRKRKLQQIRQERQAFPNTFKRTDLAHIIHLTHDAKTNEVLEQEHNQVSIAGRIMMRRLMGKASFVHIQDVSGMLQLYIKADGVSIGVYEEFKTWDIGDIIGAT